MTAMTTNSAFHRQRSTSQTDDCTSISTATFHSQQRKLRRQRNKQKRSNSQTFDGLPPTTRAETHVDV